VLFSHRHPTPTEVAEESIDIDVTPVMNMFIILIPFLVSMAVFTHLSIIEFSLPPNVGTGLDDSKGKPKLKPTVVVSPDGLLVTLGDTMLDSLGITTSGEFDFPALRTTLVDVRTRLEEKEELIIASRDTITFNTLVKVMDVGRETGFTRLGLSSATQEPHRGE